MTGTPRILEDGTVIYPKRGKEPPPCLDGYVRKAEQGPDAWILIPLWRYCEYRTHIKRKREDCNCEVLIPICGHSNSNGIEVTLKICEVCKLCQKN